MGFAITDEFTIFSTLTALSEAHWLKLRFYISPEITGQIQGSHYKIFLLFTTH